MKLSESQVFLSREPLGTATSLNLSCVHHEKDYKYMKKCYKCREEKELKFFPWQNKSKNQKMSICKLCDTERRKIFRERNPHIHKNWVSINRKKINAYAVERRKNPEIKIAFLVRKRIKEALKILKTSRSTEKMIGCSLSFLRQYLESQFLPGMTWDNHSKDGWHIDHIIPCASFDLTKEEEQRKCFHYTNLMPRWATTDIAKANNSNQIGNLNKSNKLLDLVNIKS